MDELFAKRTEGVPQSFIREILKLTQSKEVISFAGGLPNPAFFPVKEVSDAAVKVLEKDGRSVLQYSNTEGYPPLREYISEYYRQRKNLKIPVEDIMITSGSQQATALTCMVLLNKGENVVIERPAYLGAIQSISFFEPVFRPIELLEDGIDIEALEYVYSNFPVKLFYSVPNFQNPTGITYSVENRKQIGEILSKHNSVFIEDDPYYEIKFKDVDIPSIKTFCENNVLLNGSFSKMVAPGFRLGWVCAQKNIMEKLNIAKQAADLHSSYFAQRVMHQFLADNDIEIHLRKIRSSYAKQKDAMISAMAKYFPPEVKYTKPDGGMFLWVTLPEHLSSRVLLPLALKENVAFVPGDPFFSDGTGQNTMRLNFTNSSEERIEEGIKRLANVMKQVMTDSKNLTFVSY
jgi:2-aminoadipate transaminase